MLADQHGTVWAVGERECSIQRRHQKVIEEAPSPLAERLPGLRERLLDAALAATRAVDYVGAGTVEFVADRGRRVLLPGDEHPAAGGASGHRVHHRAGPGPAAAADRGRCTGWPAEPPPAPGTRSRSGSTPRIRRGTGSRPSGTAAPVRAGPSRPARSACRPATGLRLDSAVTGGQRDRRALRPDAGQADRHRPGSRRGGQALAAALAGPRSTGWSPTATCWCGCCGTRTSWPATAIPAFWTGSGAVPSRWPTCAPSSCPRRPPRWPTRPANRGRPPCCPACPAAGATCVSQAAAQPAIHRPARRARHRIPQWTRSGYRLDGFADVAVLTAGSGRGGARVAGVRQAFEIARYPRAGLRGFGARTGQPEAGAAGSPIRPRRVPAGSLLAPMPGAVVRLGGRGRRSGGQPASRCSGSRR